MKRFTLIELLVCVAIVVVFFSLIAGAFGSGGGLRGCVPINDTYSEGARSGTITKFSKKGNIWKSWEGEALITVEGQMNPEKWAFSAGRDPSPELVKALNEARESGQRVTLTYRQWWSKPISIESNYVVTAVSAAATAAPAPAEAKPPTAK